MRKHNTMINTVSSILHQVIVIICGFILPKLFLDYYGSAVNGLVSSITQFLSFVTFLEMGIGAVVQSNLYKPLADNDHVKLSKIMKSARKFYRIIAAVFSCYIVALCIFYPYTVNESFDFIFTVSLVIIISISMLMQYYFGIVNQILLNADRKAYIPINLQSLTVILNTVVCYLLMEAGYNIQIVKLGTAFIYLLRPLGMYFYVLKKYKVDYSVVIDEEPIKQKWNGLAQHIASMVMEHTDVIVLTIFSTLENVSVYSVYYNVVRGVQKLFLSIIDSLRATCGKFIAENNKTGLDNYFSKMEFVIHFTNSIAFGCTLTLIVPFVQVYTNGINDADYINQIFGVVITMAYLAYSLRCFYNMPVLAAGHYKETQNAAFIEAIINVVLSVILVYNFGLIGVAIGTFAAMSYRVFYLIFYLSKHILCRKWTVALKYIVVDSISIILTKLFTGFINLEHISYLWWIIMAIQIFGICTLITLLVNFCFFGKKSVETIKQLIHKK